MEDSPQHRGPMSLAVFHVCTDDAMDAVIPIMMGRDATALAETLRQEYAQQPHVVSATSVVVEGLSYEAAEALMRGARGLHEIGELTKDMLLQLLSASQQ